MKSNRIWFYHPTRAWSGWRSLWPVTGLIASGGRTLVLGWPFTGQVVLALRSHG
jgi:hypothetical protein